MILRIKAIQYNPDRSCTVFMEDNTYKFIKDLNTVSFILKQAGTFFQDEPEGIMELDLDAKDNARFFNKDNIRINLNESEEVSGIQVDDKKLNVAGISALTKYLEHTIHTNNNGLFNFIKRIIDIDRRNSVEDILKFMANSELPITESGDLLGYKILEKASQGYVDKHTHLVHQQIGDKVWMNPEQVTFNKDMDCACGLHIASLKYLRMYWDSRSVLCLVQIKPEDIVSVPKSCDTKVRVSEYHILDVIKPNEAEDLIYENEDYDESKYPDFMAKLNKAIHGEYPEPVREVFIRKPTAKFKEDVQTTVLTPEPVKETIPKKSKAAPKKVTVKTVVKPKKTVSVKRVDDIAAKLNISLLVPKIADKTITVKEAQAIWDYKKANNISWKDLGIDDKLRKKLGRIAGIY